MKKVLLFSLFALLMMSGRAQTIDVTAPCLGATFTFTLDPTESPDASGRNVYFYSQASIEIQFNTQANRWEVRARGGNFDVYYFNTFASAPNPPDHLTSAWEDASFCDGTGAPTVTGNGTQNVLGTDPCASLGGDSDGDGVCDPNDACPGNDDDADMDNDNIPDACDDNPTVADGVLVQAPCLDDDQPVILLVGRVDETGRNVYINETYQIEVRYDAEMARWEVTAEEPGTDVYFYNEFASFPDPPASSGFAWTPTGSLCAGSSVTVSGTGTQIDLGCTMTIAFTDIITTAPTCPGGEDGTLSVVAMNAKGPITYSLNGMTNTSGSFTGLTAEDYNVLVRDGAFPTTGSSVCEIPFVITIAPGADNVPPTITCPEAIVVSTDPDQCTATINYAAPEGVDNCAATTSRKTGLGSGMAFPLGITTETYEVTDAGGNVAECNFTVTVQDTEAPTAFCQTTLTVALDTGGIAILSPELLDMGSSDNCGEITFSLDRDSLFCNDRGELMIMLTATDEAGLSASCTTAVTVSGDEQTCTTVSTDDLLAAAGVLPKLPLYPNPARDLVYLDFTGLDYALSGIRVLIFNSLGQRVLSETLAGDQQQPYRLDTGSLAAGVYYIQAWSSNRPRTVNRLIIGK